MEKKGYRDNLALISSAFPNRGALTIAEVASFYGVSISTVRRWVDTGVLEACQERGRCKKIVVPVCAVAQHLTR